jgi:hypothetical protein
MADFLIAVYFQLTEIISISDQFLTDGSGSFMRLENALSIMIDCTLHSFSEGGLFL